jgi:hypothetical protein
MLDPSSVILAVYLNRGLPGTSSALTSLMAEKTEKTEYNYGEWNWYDAG